MDTSLDIRWKQRFENYRKALQLLTKAVNIVTNARHSGDIGDELILQEEGLIQRFEYTWELSWNVMKDYLTDQGITNIMGSKDSFKEAFRYGLIEDEQGWLDTLQSRKLTSNNYNEEIAEEVVSSIIDRYHDLFVAFENKMNSLTDIQ